MKKLVYITNSQVVLEGMLNIPLNATGLVLFVHGSGSSRLSPRNNFVADILHKAGFATLLIDLLSQQEDEIYQTRFDIRLLVERLEAIVQWLKHQPETVQLNIGLFGASTGAAAALYVAAKLGKTIKAVVSRGGRPDLAIDVLNQVVSPTLLIVGGNDFKVIELNQLAYKALTCVKHLDQVPHATHLFEESGCLEEVSRLTQEWFKKYI